jgi:succinoglycan biosynthesis protein ExoL
MSKIAFFGQNMNDAAVRRRAIAFQRAGHEVVGFMPRRGPVEQVEWQIIDLGETKDNAYGQRILSIIKGARTAAKHAELLKSCDLIYARNLDMLALAVRVCRRLKLIAPMVYECLDVHHRLVGSSIVAKALRRFEGKLLKRCSLVVISSPRFETEHFARYHSGDYRSFLIENRMIEGDEFPDRPAPPTPTPSAKLRIGWFGNLRCRRSLDLLLGLADRHPDEVELHLRGYPATGVFPNFEEELMPYQNVIFGGRYKAPMDLAAIYETVDVVWAGDWYEAGSNSVWLLPNRIYEGGYFATPALAPAGTQTAKWLSDHGGGLLLNEPIEASLEDQIVQLIEDPTVLQQHRAHLLSVPREAFVEDQETITAMILTAKSA